MIAVLPLASALSVGAESAVAVRAGFRGELLKVGVLEASTAGCIVTHAYPRFYLKVRLAERPAAPLVWKPGEVVTLGVHSLEQLFGGEPTEGAAYAFSIGVVRKGARLQFCELKVESGPPPR